MAKKVVKWVGSAEAQARVLQEHGYPLTVEPGRRYSLPADVAENLVASSQGWEFAKTETADEILARIAEASDDELDAFAGDSRKKVKAAATAELERRRAEPESADEEVAE